MGGQDDKILKRIKNLLNMAEDASSPNEAMIAARRARLLMDKHQIKKEDLFHIKEDSFGTASGDYTPPRMYPWILKICATIGALNDCEAVVNRSRPITFIYRGFKSDAIIAKYLHDYIIRTCNRSLKKVGVTGLSNRNFYKNGFADEISRKITTVLDERKKNFEQAGQQSLVIQKSALIKAHFDILPAGIPPKSRRAATEEEYQSYRRGVIDAENVSLNQQVSRDNNLPLEEE